MKILFVHNFYGSAAPSGENQVFQAEKEMLLSRGHDLETFTRHSDELRGRGVAGLVLGALSALWNPWTAREISRVVDRFRPDIVHVHNTFPLISPSIFRAIGSRAARVLTLHNYRLFCPAAIPMRAGRVCTECLDRHTVRPAVVHGCYRNSRLATLPLAVCVALHRLLGTWHRQVDAFIALTEFQRERMVAAGLPARCVHVKPNFFPGSPAVIPWGDRRPCVVFVGRLTAEKGVRTLVQAWLQWGTEAPELRLIGDGGLRSALERIAASQPPVPVRFLGQLAAEAARAEIARARMLILPSQCFEGFPMVVGEAFAFGTPAAVSNIGPLPAIVRHGVNGIVFEPADPDSLLRQVRRFWDRPGSLESLGKGACNEFETKYTSEKNYDELMAIYRQAISASRGNSGK